MFTRSNAWRCVALTVPAIGAAAMLGLASIGPAAAHEACTEATVEGEYALQARGLTENLTHHTANLGRILVDRRGQLSGQLTVSVNGRLAVGQTLRGAYTIQGDCTGTETFTIGADPTQRTANFVVADHGRLIDFLETDDGTVFGGTATRQ